MLKRFLEYYLLFSRWLLAPFFIMLTVGLFALIVNAARHLFIVLSSIGSNTEDRVIIDLLRLVDFTLIGALVMLVTISVYENFVSGVPAAKREGYPQWMGGIEFTRGCYALW